VARTAKKRNRTGPRATIPAAAQPPARRRSTWWRSWTALVTCGIVVFAIALRLPHLGHDLPWLMEEAIPFRDALSNWMSAGRPDWNPHRFHYPSLVYDLHLFVQNGLFALGRLAGWWGNSVDFLMGYIADPTRMVVAGRFIHLLADLVTVIATARAGERLRPGSGLLAAILVAGAASLVRASRLIYTDTVLAAFAALCIERVIAYHQSGGSRRLWTAAAFAGLAAGSKYPGIALLAPVLVEVVRRERARAAVPILQVLAIAGVTFLITTPYMVLDWRTFVGDVEFLRRLTGGGHLGNFERIGLGYHLRNLVADLGPAGVAALAAGLLALALRREGWGAVVPVAVGFAVFALPIAVARIEVERYLVPVIPFAALLAAWGALSWAASLTGVLRKLAAGGVVIAVAVPVVLTGLAAARAGTTSTQVQALHWCERMLKPDDFLISEIYGPPLITRSDATRIEQYSLFRTTSREVQQRIRARRWYPAVMLPITTVGRAGNPVRDPSGRVVTVEVTPQGADLDRVFYDLRLFRDVDYVITSDAVRGRFAADSARFPAPNRLYHLLDQTAEVTARFRSGGTVDGPEIIVYRMTSATQEQLAREGELDALWWTAPIPDTYRAQAQAIVTGGPPAVVPPRAADGTPAAWVTSLAPLFAARFESFATAMAVEHQAAGQPARVWPFACAILDLDPTNLGAWSMLGWCADQLGRWDQALPRFERGFAAAQRSGRVSGEAQAMLTQARVRARETGATRREER